MLDAASELRDAVGAPVPMETAGLVLDLMFGAFDQFLGVLSRIQDAMQSAYDATVATGPVWDDADAARVRAKAQALNEAMSNLASCRDTLGGAHMLLSHSTFALADYTAPGDMTGETAEDPAGDSAGTDKEAKTDE
ncbi:hypothetical protein AB0L06_10805 [Spirillospora sp. NPDC052269]